MDATLAWARNLFRRYYRREPVFLPPRFGRREYGFLFLGEKGMVRHTGFQTREELADFLVTRGPAHVYYSVAYYERPNESDMAAKGWLGADLIFDLDADHLPGAQGTPFPTLLQRVRDETVKIVEEFLMGHFGFEEKDLRVVFSGGRGYHVHVTHADVQSLGSAERREIVDYVTGKGLDVERLLKRRTFAVDAYAGHEKRKEAWELPSAESPGWPGLFTRTLASELERIAAMEAGKAHGDLVTLPGVGAKRAVQILEQLTPKRLAGLRQGSVDRVPALTDKRVISALAARTKVLAIGEADEPVTADVKRLIRLPGSLHGKTGLGVMPLTLKELPTFDPLRDAVALSDDPVRVVVAKPVKVGLKGTLHDLGEGTHEVPEHVAAFLVLQRKATLAPEVVA